MRVRFAELKEGTDTEICRELCVSLGLTACDA